MYKMFAGVAVLMFSVCILPVWSQTPEEAAASNPTDVESPATPEVTPPVVETPAPTQESAPAELPIDTPTPDEAAPEAAAPATPVATPPPESAPRKLEVLTQEEAVPKFVVFLPEQIDMVWYWYFYTDEQQHIVQSAVEKALMKCNYEVIDLSLADLFSKQEGSLAEVTSPREAVKKAAELGATYAIIGKASATMTSRDVAYGVNVIRSSAEVDAKVIRVSDGKIMAMEDASSTGGGQAQKAAAQGALKEAGARLGSKLCSSINLLLAP